MIMWPKAKRSVSDAVASSVSSVARGYNSAAVGVFVDEDAETIMRRCSAAGVGIAQLHGDDSRAQLGLIHGLQIIYVMHARPDGTVVTPAPSQPVDWILIDGLQVRMHHCLVGVERTDSQHCYVQGGSGQALDWKNLQLPAELPTSGWLLAGGLTPENVADAITQATPGGVDVSSGVCLSDGLRKDPECIKAFVQNARAAFA